MKMSDLKNFNYLLYVNSIEMCIYRVFWLFIMIDLNLLKKLLKNIMNSKSLIYILNWFFLILCMYCVYFMMY